MPPEFDIRLLGPDDAEALRAGLDAILPDDWRGAGPLPPSSHYRDALGPGGLIVVFASQSGAPVGYVSAHAAPSLVEPGTSVLLDDLLVAPAYRNQGLGRALVERLIDALRARFSGPVFMWSGTAAGNAACQAAFRAAGGEPVDAHFIEFDWRF